jgi:hypothetical protein
MVQAANFSPGICRQLAKSLFGNDLPSLATKCLKNAGWIPSDNLDQGIG